ncbi:Ig-like domain-containing protein [Devosia nitrariae]|uniref:Calcium-binding protein n=1 Tax=Devosia nitrariae TaxID=2071872 RepID=A0ABQ5WE88_9HYPH|nr:Ig-like domain-containing protein [Devosia nitrariae]GLQ58099.1 calcium-binding protein [Devosia nitrariae]
MPTLSNGSELTVLEGGGPHVAYSFTLTDAQGDVSDPIGALPDFFYGWVTLESVDVFDGFFAITGFTHHGRIETVSELDTYLFDNDGNFIRTVHAEAAFLSLDVVSVTAESSDDFVVTYKGATPYGSGQNTQYGEHQIIVEDGVELPDTFVNTAPVLSDLNVVLAGGQSVLDVEFLATDADFDFLSFTIVDGPDYGTVELDTRFDGNHYPFPEGDYLGSVHYHASFLSGNLFDYRPQSGFVGTDTFTVMATDGQGNSNLSTITITVGGSMAGPEYMSLTNGVDIVRYQTSDHAVLVAARGGDDDLTGSRYNDSLNGGAGNDLLRGERGRDKLTGGQGVDRMQGGADNDTFIFAAGDIADPRQSNGRFDHIIDFHGAGHSGSGEQDFISLLGFGGDATLTFDRYASDNQLLQIYKVTDPDNPGNDGLIMVQMADGPTQIGDGDYYFL